MASAVKNPSGWPSESNAFDPVTSARKLPYNESSAKLLSTPAFYTDVCVPDEEEEEDNDCIIINEKASTPSVVTEDNKTEKMCQNDNKPLESHDFLEENAQFTNIGAPVASSQDSINHLNGIFPSSSAFHISSISFSRIPFLDTSANNERSAIDANSSLSATFENISISALDTSNAPSDFSLSVGEDLYDASSDDSTTDDRFNFENHLNESLRASTEDDSSVEIIDKPELEVALRNQNTNENVGRIDVIQLVDSEDDNRTPSPPKPRAPFKRRTSKNERIMPQLLPHGSDLDSQDENNDSRGSSVPDSIEVIDVPSSPEMPRLIPFTSETEEPLKIKQEGKKAETSCNVSNSFCGILQPKVVVRKLSYESCSNHKVQVQKDSSLCYLDKEEESNEPMEPDVDVIDGLNFYSFSSKSEMDVYWDKFSDNMSFQVANEDGLNGESYFRDYSIIVPTKTNDITLIKGWRTKNFAPDSCPPADKDYLSDEDSKADDNNCILVDNDNDSDSKLDMSSIFENTDIFKEIPASAQLDPIVVNGNIETPSTIEKQNHKVCNETKSEVAVEILDKDSGSSRTGKSRDTEKQIDNSVFVDETADQVSDKPSNKSIIVLDPSEKKPKTETPLCAFFSEALENFLKNESKLNVPILQKTNPNIAPIPRGAPILSVGNLRKHDQNSDFRSFSSLLKTSLSKDKPRAKQHEIRMLSQPSSSGIQRPSSVKVRQKSSGIVASTKVLKKSKIFKSKYDLPMSQRVVLRLKKENSGTIDGYKITNISSDATSNKTSETTPPKKKTKAELSTVKEAPILIKETLFSENRSKENNLLTNFLTNLNRLGTRNHLTVLVNAKQTYFTTCVVSQEHAAACVSAVTSVKNLIYRKKQEGKSNSKFGRSPTSANKQKVTPSQNQKTKPSRKRKSTGCDSNVDLSSEMRGKRSIRLPARFLDSAILAAGTEWVSPVVPFDETLKKNKKNIPEKETKYLPGMSLIDQSKLSSSNDCKSSTIETEPKCFSSEGEEVGSSSAPETSKPKRIATSPHCICKNTTRVMAYNSAEKRLKCQCVDTPLKVERTDESAEPSVLSNQKSPQSNNVVLPTSICEAAAALNFSKIVAVPGTKIGPVDVSEEMPSVVSSANADSKGTVPLTLSNLNLKPASFALPGTNKLVSFLVVPKKSPQKAGSPLSPQSAAYENIKVSPPKIAVDNTNMSVLWSPTSSSTVPGQSVVRLPVNVKPSILVKKLPPSQAPVYPLITGVYCNLSNKQSEGKKQVVSKLVMPENQARDSNTACSIVPLNTSPVVFTLSQDGLVRSESSGQNLKSIEVKKDHVFVKSNSKADSILSTALKNTCSSQGSQTVKFSVASELKNSSSSSASSVCMNPAASNSAEDVLRSPTSKKPQSLTAVKLGEKYILCPTSAVGNSSSNENTITLYPATDDLQPSLPVCSEPADNVVETQKPSEIASNSSSDAQVMCNAAFPKLEVPPPVVQNDEPKPCSANSEADPFVDVESFDNCDIEELLGGTSSSCSSPKIDGISVSSSASNSVNVSEDEDSKDVNGCLNAARPLINNRKNFMERERRSQLRQCLNMLRLSDTSLELKSNTVDLLDAATDLVRAISKEHLILAWNVKKQLAKRETLNRKYQKAILECMTHVKNALAVNSCQIKSGTPSDAVSTLQTLDTWRLKLKEKGIDVTKSEESSSSSASSHKSSKLYQLLQCNEKLSPSNDFDSDNEIIDVGGPAFPVPEQLTPQKNDNSSRKYFTLGMKPRSSSSGNLDRFSEWGQSNGTESSIVSTSTSAASQHRNTAHKRKSTSDVLLTAAAEQDQIDIGKKFTPVNKKERTQALHRNKKRVRATVGGSSDNNHLGNSDHSYVSLNPKPTQRETSQLDSSVGSSVELPLQVHHDSLLLPADRSFAVVTKSDVRLSSADNSNHPISKVNENVITKPLNTSPKSGLCTPVGNNFGDFVVSTSDSEEVVLSVESLKHSLAESLTRGGKSIEGNKIVQPSEIQAEPVETADDDDECLEKDLLDFSPLVIDETKCELKVNEPCVVSVGGEVT